MVEELNLARESVSEEELKTFKDTDRSKTHYVFVDGPEVSDLVIVSFNQVKSKFDFRKCRNYEWVEYFNKNLI